WPERASVAYFQERHGGRIPPGIERCITPAAADAWLTALRLYGTRTFAEVVAPALELAEQGFPTHQFLRDNLETYQASVRRYAFNAATFLPDGQLPRPGQLLRQPVLGQTFRRLCQAEAQAGGSREDGLLAAR